MENIDQGIENDSKKFCEIFFSVKIMLYESCFESALLSGVIF